jgi:hypothetical protein
MMNSTQITRIMDRSSIAIETNGAFRSVLVDLSYKSDEVCCERLSEILATFAPKDASSGLLHATISTRILQSIQDSNCCPFESQTMPGTITYEICDLPLPQARWYLWKAFDLQAVVHLDIDSRSRDEILPDLKDAMLDCFTGLNNPAGQLFLCGIPALVLSPEELSPSLNINEDALLKVFNSMQEQERPKWEVFTAKVHLVEPGFRPSAHDLARGGR